MNENTEVMKQYLSQCFSKNGTYDADAIDLVR